MKVIHILPSLTQGGAETVVVNTLIELKKRDVEVKLIVIVNNSTTLYDLLVENDIQVISLSRKKWLVDFTPKWRVLTKVVRKIWRMNVKSFTNRKIKKIVDKECPDILHFHIDSIMMSDMEFAKNVKLFYTCHSDIERYIKNNGDKWKKSFELLVEKDAVIVALNDSMKQKISELFPIANVNIVYNGINVKVDKDGYDKQKLCTIFGIEKDTYLIVHVGRLEKVKNFEKSIQILSCIREKNEKAYLIIIGEGNSDYKKELQELAAKLKVEKYVIFAGYRSDVRQILCGVDVGLLPSLKEGFSLTAVEYQLAGIPSIVSSEVPIEVCCNSNCERLDINDSNEKWAEKMLNKTVQIPDFELIKFDQEKVINKLVDLYEG